MPRLFSPRDPLLALINFIEISFSIVLSLLLLLSLSCFLLLLLFFISPTLVLYSSPSLYV
ncbi:hypothetical protein BC939DRAFT_437754 [Gamsiella multidivaricata]|uniref:uncharacterized protein n=1 Tax=Gamsiella multidivaricata TaxID=101098 RepID=UPI00221FB793|nr:uncharacterized protein BC939DRAFT_437754 [Gamsiella multidivaricata]KAI7831155.1 hypothetical protein BC939DRAFT_437754 [Gamsiella multidivaricata]